MKQLSQMPSNLLLGSDLSLLEGLAQSLSAQGHGTCVASTFGEARELATIDRPLTAVIDRDMAVGSASEVLGLSLAAGGALVLDRASTESFAAVPHVLQRHVL